jgi:hypothetical protein
MTIKHVVVCSRAIPSSRGAESQTHREMRNRACEKDSCMYISKGTCVRHFGVGLSNEPSTLGFRC